jgi:membrane protein
MCCMGSRGREDTGNERHATFARVSKPSIRRLVRFLRHGLWEADLRRITGWRALVVGLLRIVIHVGRAFSHNLVGLQAAGLTLVSLFALVPLLALLFTVAKELGYADKLELWLTDVGTKLPDQAQEAVEHVRALVADVNFGALGLIGSVVMIWSALALFTHVEKALNGIWRAQRRRSWLRTITDFMAVVVVVPPLMVAALVASSVLSGVNLITGLREQAEWLAWIYQAGLGFVPHVLIWMSLAALYKLMPKAPVRWRCALVGGVVAGSSLVVLHDLYLRFQVGVAQANAIYATLAALPLLVIYLQLLWTVVLAGAEVSYAVQNLGSLRRPRDLPPPAYGMRVRTMWHIMRAAAVGMRSGKQGVRLTTFAMGMDLPRAWIDDAACLLIDAALVKPLPKDCDVLVPTRPPEQIHMDDLLKAIEGRGKVQVQRVALPDELEAQLSAAFDTAAHSVSGVAF